MPNIVQSVGTVFWEFYSEQQNERTGQHSCQRKGLRNDRDVLLSSWKPYYFYGLIWDRPECASPETEREQLSSLTTIADRLLRAGSTCIDLDQRYFWRKQTWLLKWHELERMNKRNHKNSQIPGRTKWKNLRHKGRDVM